MKHRTSLPYLLTPDDIRESCESSSHALRGIKFDSIRKVQDAHNWSPDFSFSHLFHFLMENIGRLPTWNDFAGFYYSSGCDFLGREREERYRQLLQEGFSDEVATDALDWRIGLAYYGIVRDIFTVVQLRARGIDVRCHPLADTLFRVDAWVGRTIVNLRVNNPRYRDFAGGRKLPPEELYEGSEPGFRYEYIALDAADKFGVVHLPKESDVDDLVEKLQRENDDFRV